MSLLTLCKQVAYKSAVATNKKCSMCVQGLHVVYSNCVCVFVFMLRFRFTFPLCVTSAVMTELVGVNMHVYMCASVCE